MASTKLKLAVLAPMPMAWVRTATDAKPGLRRRVRTPYRRSCKTYVTRHLHPEAGNLPLRRDGATEGSFRSNLQFCPWTALRSDREHRVLRVSRSAGRSCAYPGGQTVPAPARS